MFIWLFSKYFFWIQISWLRVQSFSIQSKAHLWFISSNICGVRAGEVGPVLVLFFTFFNPLPINLWPVLEQTKNITFFGILDECNCMSAVWTQRKWKWNCYSLLMCDDYSENIEIMPLNVDIFVPTFANTIEITCNPQHVRSCLFLRV